MLSHYQRFGAAILLCCALLAWLVYAVWPTPDTGLPEPPAERRHRSWEERKDSMRLADSLRYAQWAAEREQRYDSFRLADSLRRAEWKRIRQQQYDSFRLADSLWRDSVGWRYARRMKRDTVLDLNHTDTTELQLIRGIGPYAATRIIRYREQLGGFYSPAQLTDEPLSACHLDTLINRFVADTTVLRTISVNAASLTELQRHPYLRYDQAKAIYHLRRRLVHLSSIDDLRSLPELTTDDLLRLRPYLRFE